MPEAGGSKGAAEEAKEEEKKEEEPEEEEDEVSGGALILSVHASVRDVHALILWYATQQVNYAFVGACRTWASPCSTKAADNHSTALRVCCVLSGFCGMTVHVCRTIVMMHAKSPRCAGTTRTRSSSPAMPRQHLPAAEQSRTK